MCFTTTDNRQIHTTARQLLSHLPKDNGNGTKIAMPKHTKKIIAYTSDGIISGSIVGFEKNSRTIIIKPDDTIKDDGKDHNVYISFDTPAEKVR